MTRRILPGTGLGAAIVLFAAGSHMLTGGGCDSSRWKALRDGTARDNPGAGMISDLEKRVLRVGMTRAEVAVLPGEPDSTEDDRYICEIGASAYGVDYEYFVIEFDNAGKLLRHSIMRG